MEPNSNNEPSPTPPAGYMYLPMVAAETPNRLTAWEYIKQSLTAEEIAEREAERKRWRRKTLPSNTLIFVYTAKDVLFTGDEEGHPWLVQVCHNPEDSSTWEYFKAYDLGGEGLTMESYFAPHGTKEEERFGRLAALKVWGPLEITYLPERVGEDAKGLPKEEPPA